MNRFVIVTCLLLLSSNALIAQTSSEATPAAKTPLTNDSSAKQQIEAFEKMMTGVTMAGSFTMVPPNSDGEEQKSPKLFSDRYEIKKVKKMKKGDFWVITARIKYGDKDRRFPVPVEVKWAGSTPVITVDSVTIPGMGTFDARVLIKGKRYAGTWRHDDVVGHMFGMLEPTKVEGEKKTGPRGPNQGA